MHTFLVCVSRLHNPKHQTDLACFLYAAQYAADLKLGRARPENMQPSAPMAPEPPGAEAAKAHQQVCASGRCSRSVDTGGRTGSTHKEPEVSVQGMPSGMLT